VTTSVGERTLGTTRESAHHSEYLSFTNFSSGSGPCDFCTYDSDMILHIEHSTPFTHSPVTHSRSAVSNSARLKQRVFLNDTNDVVRFCANALLLWKCRLQCWNVVEKWKCFCRCEDQWLSGRLGRILGWRQCIKYWTDQRADHLFYCGCLCRLES